MPDFRELFDNPEEGFRSMWAGIRSHMHTVMVSRVAQASTGHTVQVQPTVQQAIKDPTLTKTSYVDYPLVVDSPVHFVGGNGTVLTHGLGPVDIRRFGIPNLVEIGFKAGNGSFRHGPRCVEGRAVGAYCAAASWQGR